MSYSVLQVSSEGEKPPATEENVEEGREAEASPSTNTRYRNRGTPPIRIQRQMMTRPGYGQWANTRNPRQGMIRLYLQ